MPRPDLFRCPSSAASVALLFALVAGASGPALAADPEPVTAEPAAAAAAPAPVAPAPADASVVASDEEVAAVYGSMPADDPSRHPRLDTPTRPWRYDDRYLFQLTRGLDEEQLSTTAEVACMVGTVPVDVVTLPAAAIAGLFGS